MTITATAEKPPVSERKLYANRNNATFSTGPRSSIGRSKVSRNAIKHGLTSKLVVLPNEDPAEFDAMHEAWMDEWKPKTGARRILVEFLIKAEWKLRRFNKAETAHTSKRMQQAMLDHDNGVHDDVERGILLVLGDNPSSGNELLVKSTEGLTWVIDEWNQILAQATDSQLWCAASHHSLVRLMGHAIDTPLDDMEDIASISDELRTWNDPEVAADAKPYEGNADSPAKAASNLLAFITARLTACMQSRLDIPQPEAKYRELMALTTFDLTKEGAALQRYEAPIQRSFVTALKNLMAVEKSGDDLICVENDADVVELERSYELNAQNKATKAEAEPPTKAAEPSVPAQSTPVVPVRPSDDHQIMSILRSKTDVAGSETDPISKQ